MAKPLSVVETDEKARLAPPHQHQRSHGVGMQVSWKRAKGRIFDVAWSPTDPTRLCTAGEDCGFVWQLDEHELKPVAELTPAGRNAESLCMRCAYHPAGQLVLLGNADGCIDVHSEADGASRATLRTGSVEEEVYGLTFLSDEGLLGVAVGDTVQQWDLRRPRQTAWTQLDAHQGGIAYGGEARNPERRAYVFNLASRGRVLAAALSDGTCRLLDGQSIKPLHTIDEHMRRGASVFACALSPSTPLLAAAGSDGSVLVYDLRQIKRGPLSEVRGHRMAVHGVTFAKPDVLGMRSRAEGGELLVSGGADCALCITDASSGETICRYAHPAQAPLLCATSTGTTARFATGGGSGNGGSNIGLPQRLQKRRPEVSDNVLCVWSAATKTATAEEAGLFSATCLPSPLPHPRLETEGAVEGAPPMALLEPMACDLGLEHLTSAQLTSAAGALSMPVGSVSMAPPPPLPRV